MTPDVASVLVEGPWEHRFVAANGARFHVAECGEGPLVLLLHGFPQFWWAWRHQLPVLAEAGYRAVAVDLRGYGASDKPPRGYDTITSTADVASLVRSLGEASATVVGHGWGGWIAWAMATFRPAVTHAVASLSMPHPLVFRQASARSLGQARANAYLVGLQRPFVPERQISGDAGYVSRVLREWASPQGIWPSLTETQRYADAMALPFVAHSAAEYSRWLVRSQFRPDGWRFASRVKEPVRVPAMHVHGADDGAVLAAHATGSAAHVTGPFTEHLLPGAGHFLAEETPDRVNSLLTDWLASHH